MLGGHSYQRLVFVRVFAFLTRLVCLLAILLLFASPRTMGNMPPGLFSLLDSEGLPLRQVRGEVEFLIHSPQENKVVLPGHTVSWALSIQVDPSSSEGLAMFIVDLVPDPLNPEPVEFSTGGRAPEGMEGFDRPGGLTNPDPSDPFGSGYGGIPSQTGGENYLLQIGGAQNTFGRTGPCLGSGSNICLGSDVDVEPGVGQGPGGRVVAVGSFTAPQTGGVYRFSLASAIANVLEHVSVAPEISPTRAAHVNLRKPDFSVWVGGASASSTQPSHPSALPQSPSTATLPMTRGVVILPPDGSMKNRTHLQFRWKPFDIEPPQYTLWIVEDDNSGNPFESGLPVLSFTTEGTEPRTLVTSGISFDTNYAWRVTDGVPPTSSQGSSGPIHRFSTITLPDWMMPITATEPMGGGLMQPGLTLFDGPRQHESENYNHRYTIMVNEAGELVYFLDTDPERFYITDVRMFDTEDGRQGRLLGGRGKCQERTLDGKIAWESPYGLVLHHEYFPLSEGHLMSIAPDFREVDVDGTMMILRGDQVVEIDRHSKEIVWNWTAWDYWDYHYYDPLEGDLNDWTHCNSVVYDAVTSRVYFSSRHLSRITCIDYPSGNIVYNMGKDWPSNDTDFGHNLFTYQHAIQLLPNGNLMVYDNGNLNEPLEAPRQSKSIEIAFSPDASSPTNASIVWEYEPEEDNGDPMYCRAKGDSDRLPNGNTLMTLYEYLEIHEVDSNGNIVWRLQLDYDGDPPAPGFYRAERIDQMILYTPGDTDGDWDIDLRDIGEAQRLFTDNGSADLTFPATLCDYDGDDDIDIFDLAELAYWMTGPGI